MISLTNLIALLSAVDEELGGQMKSKTVVLKAKHHVFVHLNYNNMVGACIVAIASLARKHFHLHQLLFLKSPESSPFVPSLFSDQVEWQ